MAGDTTTTTATKIYNCNYEATNNKHNTKNNENGN
jgi:hypothetical protein